jgi:hypothetical protein
MNPTFIKIQKRPNKSVEFYLGSEKLHQHIEEKYIATGKCLEWRKVEFIDDDQLEIKLTSIWKDQSAVDEILDDELLIEESFVELVHNFENEIKTVSVELDKVSMLRM